MEYLVLNSRDMASTRDTADGDLGVDTGGDIPGGGLFPCVDCCVLCLIVLG